MGNRADLGQYHQKFAFWPKQAISSPTRVSRTDNGASKHDSQTPSLSSRPEGPPIVFTY